MSEEYDAHGEMESEDGGVALVKYGSSDEMDVDDDSSATSAPSSGSEPSSGELAEMNEVAGSVLNDAQTPSSQVGQTFTLVDVGGGNFEDILYTPPTNHAATLVSMTNHMFSAEALSGELSTLPEHNDFHTVEETSDPNHPLDPPFGTPHTFPTPLVAAPNVSMSEGGETSVAMPTLASHAAHHQVSPHVVGDMSVPTGYSDHHSALPLFTAAFGLDFLPQPAVPADVITPISVDEYPADYWDDIEDNPKNFYVYQFFNYWKRMYANDAPNYPRISDLAIDPSKVQRPKRVSAGDIGKEHEDVQGIHWSRFRTTRERAREVRKMTYRNHRNVAQMKLGFGTPGYKAHFHNNVIPASDTYFCFREMNMKYRPSYSHFQLRHNLSACSKSAIFYSHRPHDDDFADDDEGSVSLGIGPKIMCYNPEANTIECALNPTKLTDKDAPKMDRLTALTASDGVLVAGSIEGIYAIKSLSDTFETEPTTGVITESSNPSTNHIHTALDRHSGLPNAIISSNDKTLRTLDCTTNKFIRAHPFPYQINCSATSPDGRLRLLVGDETYPIVSNAETGEVIAKLPNHQDYGFACAWAPDGITMATGHQDGLVQVWDARKLSRSIRTIPMEMGGCRALQFSPLGSGKRVLVLAEPADFVHVVDAQSYNSKQTIDFFGEISGISMPPDGSRLYIANSDLNYGGLMEFKRSWDRKGYAKRPKQSCSRDDLALAEAIWNNEDENAGIKYADIMSDSKKRRKRYHERRKGYKLDIARTFDWLSDDEMGVDDNMRIARDSRERRDIGLGGMDP